MICWHLCSCKFVLPGWRRPAMERVVSKSGRQCLGWLVQHHSRVFATAFSSSSSSTPVDSLQHSHAIALPHTARLLPSQDRLQISSSVQRLSPLQQSVLASWAVRSLHTSSVVDARKTAYSNFGHKRKPASKWSYFYSAFLTVLFIGFFGLNGWVLAAENSVTDSRTSFVFCCGLFSVLNNQSYLNGLVLTGESEQFWVWVWLI